MRYFFNFLEDRKIFYTLDSSSASNNPYLGSYTTSATELRKSLTSGEKTLTEATNSNTANTDSVDSFASAGSNTSQILSLARGSTDDNTTAAWTASDATTIPKTDAGTEWQARFGEIPLKADGTLDTEAMAGMVSAEFNTIYSAGTGGGASGGLDLGGHSMASFNNLSFDEQMQIAYAQKDAQMQENNAKFQDALNAQEQQAAAPQQNSTASTVALIQQGLQLVSQFM
jgi:hypothetical protein